MVCIHRLPGLRRGFVYRPLPDRIADGEWSIPTHLAEDIVRAETAIRSLDDLPHMTGIEALVACPENFGE